MPYITESALAELHQSAIRQDATNDALVEALKNARSQSWAMKCKPDYWTILTPL